MAGYVLIMDDGSRYETRTSLEAAEKAVELLGRPRFITKPGGVIISYLDITGTGLYDMRSYFDPSAGSSKDGFKVYRSEWASMEGFGPCGLIRRR